MGKPTERQKELIRVIKNQMDQWETSNDLHSPSHANEIETDMFNLCDDTITEEEAWNVSDAIVKLWSAIADIDPCKHRNPPKDGQG